MKSKWETAFNFWQIRMGQWNGGLGLSVVFLSKQMPATNKLIITFVSHHFLWVKTRVKTKDIWWSCSITSFLIEGSLWMRPSCFNYKKCCTCKLIASTLFRRERSRRVYPLWYIPPRDNCLQQTWGRLRYSTSSLSLSSLAIRFPMLLMSLNFKERVGGAKSLC